jgi:hypothetical protein
MTTRQKENIKYAIDRKGLSDCLSFVFFGRTVKTGLPQI